MNVRIGDVHYLRLGAAQIYNYSTEYNNAPDSINATEEYMGVGIEIGMPDWSVYYEDGLCNLNIKAKIILNGYYYEIENSYNTSLGYYKAGKGYELINKDKEWLTKFVHALIDKGLEKEGRK